MEVSKKEQTESFLHAEVERGLKLLVFWLACVVLLKHLALIDLGQERVDE